MSIYGVTDRESLDPRFKVIGKLRKGSEKKNGQFGDDLEWFRFTSDCDGVVKAFRKIYGDKPTELIVRLPHPTLEVVFPTFRETYGHNQLLKEQCDGMHIIQKQIGYKMWRGKRLCEKKCKDVESRPPCPDCPLKPIGRLSVVSVPLLYEDVVGTITAETHGWHDCLQIANELAKYEPLTGKDFRLYREKVRVGAPNKKANKRIAVDKWMVRIEATQETERMMIQGAQRQARQMLLGEPVNVPQLESGQHPVTDGDYPDEEPQIVTPGEGEFYDDVDYLNEDDIPFSVQPEPEAAKPDKSHWIDCVSANGREVKKAFWAWTHDLKLTASDVYAALQVESIHAYKGDMNAAKAQIEQYVKDHPIPAEAE